MTDVQHSQHDDGGEFHIQRNGARVAEMTYRRLGPARVLIDHTFVDPSLRGQGVARQLLDAAVSWARRSGTRLEASCSYVKVQFERDASIRDVHD